MIENNLIEYWENILQYVAKMFPNGGWYETLRSINRSRYKDEKYFINDISQFNEIFSEIVEQYAKEHNISIKELIKLAI